MKKIIVIALFLITTPFMQSHAQTEPDSAGLMQIAQSDSNDDMGGKMQDMEMDRERDMERDQDMERDRDRDMDMEHEPEQERDREHERDQSGKDEKPWWKFWGSDEDEESN